MSDLEQPASWFNLGDILTSDSEVLDLLRRDDGGRGDSELAGVERWSGRDRVTAGKGGRAYNAHSYPTKVPPEAIEPFLEHYTRPGDVVLDPFCGSGMTGLAARRTGRRAILNDLSTLSVHLAFNHTAECEPRDLKRSWEVIRSRLSSDVERLYGVPCANCHAQAEMRYTIWSDVYGCPSCGGGIRFWDEGVDKARGTVSRRLACPACHAEFRRSAALRIGVEPAWLAYSCACSRSLLEREVTEVERETLMTWQSPRGSFAPTRKVEVEREMYRRSALHLQGIESVKDFYTPRNLEALSLLWEEIGTLEDRRVRAALAFAFTNTAWHGTRMRRFNARGGHRPLTGTLYIPQLSSEANIFEVFSNKIGYLTRFFEETQALPSSQPIAIRQGSATNLSWLPGDSVDYIFTDPPFGSNIFYADCNLIAESWLGAVTDERLEAVVNRSKLPEHGAKEVEDYKRLMSMAFEEMFRVLRPGGWATVVFQSTDGEVWRAIEEAASSAGFVLHSAGILDKVQQSMKGYKGRSGSENVASFDLILHLEKSDGSDNPSLRDLDEEERRKLLLKVVQDHLASLHAEDPSERSLPYLYSVSVRALVNRGFSIRGLTMDGLRGFLETRFQESSGSWYAMKGAAEIG